MPDSNPGRWNNIYKYLGVHEIHLGTHPWRPYLDTMPRSCATVVIRRPCHGRSPVALLVCYTLTLCALVVCCTWHPFFTGVQYEVCFPRVCYSLTSMPRWCAIFFVRPLLMRCDLTSLPCWCAVLLRPCPAGLIYPDVHISSCIISIANALLVGYTFTSMSCQCATVTWTSLPCWWAKQWYLYPAGALYLVQCLAHQLSVTSLSSSSAMARRPCPELFLDVYALFHYALPWRLCPARKRGCQGRRRRRGRRRGWHPRPPAWQWWCPWGGDPGTCCSCWRRLASRTRFRSSWTPAHTKVTESSNCVHTNLLSFSHIIFCSSLPCLTLYIVCAGVRLVNLWRRGGLKGMELKQPWRWSFGLFST